ncbi:MAG: hypothetical protein AAB681_01060 [Patescibacteria group bacterium]
MKNYFIAAAFVLLSGAITYLGFTYLQNNVDLKNIARIIFWVCVVFAAGIVITGFFYRKKKKRIWTRTLTTGSRA